MEETTRETDEKERWIGSSDEEKMLNETATAAGARQSYQETNYRGRERDHTGIAGKYPELLRQGRIFPAEDKETEGYQEDGYETIWDCAKDQFGITRTTASRWMEINRRFSEGGYSPYLAEESGEGAITRASYRRCCTSRRKSWKRWIRE